MGAVSEVSPRLVLEPLPLAEEVVAIVVTDFGDLGMRHRHPSDVRCVDDQLATVGDDRLEFVEALGGGRMSSYLVGMIDNTRLTGASR